LIDLISDGGASVGDFLDIISDGATDAWGWLTGSTAREYIREAKRYRDLINAYRRPISHVKQRTDNPYDYFAGNDRYNGSFAGDSYFIPTAALTSGAVMRLGKFRLNATDPNEHINYDGQALYSDFNGRMPAEQSLAFAGTEYYNEIMFPFIEGGGLEL
jgi:hypothetical protein